MLACLKLIEWLIDWLLPCGRSGILKSRELGIQVSVSNTRQCSPVLTRVATVGSEPASGQRGSFCLFSFPHSSGNWTTHEGRKTMFWSVGLLNGSRAVGSKGLSSPSACLPVDTMTAAPVSNSRPPQIISFNEPSLVGSLEHAAWAPLSPVQ